MCRGVSGGQVGIFMNSMIRMSRLETGIVQVQPVRNLVYELIAQAVCDVALKAEEKHIDIKVSCDEALTAYFDQRWTGEAVFNILDNSVKYTKDGGKIDLSAVLQGAGVGGHGRRRNRTVSGPRDRDESERVYRGALQGRRGHGSICKSSSGEKLEKKILKIISILLLFGRRAMMSGGVFPVSEIFPDSWIRSLKRWVMTRQRSRGKRGF